MRPLDQIEGDWLCLYHDCMWQLSSAALVLAGCVKPSEPTSSKVKVTKIEAGPDALKKAQTALIEAKPGEVIEFAEGKFEFNSTLSLRRERHHDSRPGSRQDDPFVQPPGTGNRRRRPVDQQQGEMSRSKTWPSRTPRVTPSRSTAATD